MSSDDMGSVTDATDDVMDPKELSAPAQNLSAQTFASGWVPDDNSTSHTTTISHNLGYTPNWCQVWFTASGKQDYLVSWSWREDASGNPVTMSANATAVFLEIYSGQPLHGVWDPKSGWASYRTGYWRVVVG